MEVEFQIAKEDYIEFHKTQLNERFQKRIPIIAIALFFVLSTAIDKNNLNWLNAILVTIGYGLFIYLLFYLLPYLVFNRKLKMLIATEPGYSEKKKWIIEEDGLRSESPSTNSLRKWESFISAKSSEKFIDLTLVDKRFLLLPKSCFSSDDDAINFLGTIQSKISRSQGKSNLLINGASNFNLKPKPPYLLGLLCLLPLVGAFVGVALILYGVFKYKNRWLILIGTGGIIFSSGVYTSLDYLQKHSYNFNEGFIEMNKRTLNSLVKEIEFYKMQHGSYPDSLKQLDTKNQLINIFDPLNYDKKNTTFNYRIVGKKYVIFSLGLDQISGTKDDIYPTIEIDTNKMGVMVPKK